MQQSLTEVRGFIVLPGSSLGKAGLLQPFSTLKLSPGPGRKLLWRHATRAAPRCAALSALIAAPENAARSARMAAPENAALSALIAAPENAAFAALIAAPENAAFPASMASPDQAAA